MRFVQRSHGVEEFFEVSRGRRGGGPVHRVREGFVGVPLHGATI